MNQIKFLELGEGLSVDERNLVGRVADCIGAGDPYFLVFHAAFSDLVTNHFQSEKEQLMENPVYQILIEMVESYRENPRGYL